MMVLVGSWSWCFSKLINSSSSWFSMGGIVFILVLLKRERLYWNSPFESRGMVARGAVLCYNNIVKLI